MSMQNIAFSHYVRRQHDTELIGSISRARAYWGGNQENDSKIIHSNNRGLLSVKELRTLYCILSKLKGSYEYHDYFCFGCYEYPTHASA